MYMSGCVGVREKQKQGIYPYSLHPSSSPLHPRVQHVFGTEHTVPVCFPVILMGLENSITLGLENLMNILLALKQEERGRR